MARPTSDATNTQAILTHPKSNEAKRKLGGREWLAAGWSVGFAACLAILTYRIWQTQLRLTRTRTLVGVVTRDLLSEISQTLGVVKIPAVYTTEAAEQPFVWGWLSGSIYLPAQFEQIGDAAQRRSILAHELAHVLRRDAAANLVQLVVQAAFFFHPFVWWANREIRREREKCCDEFVLSTSGACPRQYSEAIVAILAAAVPNRHSIAGLAVGGQVEAVEERIAVMLSPNRRFYRRSPWSVKGVAIVVACCLLPTALVPTGRAQNAESEKQANATNDTEWHKGRLMKVGVVDGQTQKPLSDVMLELQNMGKGIDFQDVKKYTTDADGRAVLQLPDLPPTAVRIYPTKAGYVPLRVYWEGVPWPTLPETMTISLEHGKAFGGIVKNAAGEPIQGVTVDVHYWARGEGKDPHIRANIDAKTTTDKQGRWHIGDMPAEVEESELRIFFSHPDYLSDHLRYAFIPIPVYKSPALKDLFDQAAITTMQVGEAVRGQVVDEKGRPIPNAAIHTDEQYWWHKEKPRALTNDKGEFRIVGLKFDDDEKRLRPGESSLQLTVQAAGFAPEWIGVHSGGVVAPVTLRPGNKVRGRVVDESGKPLAGVGVIARRWRDHRDRLGLGMESKADGSFQITDAPADEIIYNFNKDGYMSLSNIAMTPGGKEYVVTMKPPLKIVGVVVDAATEKPINRFTLIKGIDYGDGRAPEWLTNLGYPSETISGGKYETVITQDDIPYRLRVEADGYLPGESREFRPYKPDKGEVVYNFKLQKAEPLTGVVLGLKGEPLAGAEVYLATDWIGIDNRHVRHHAGSRIVKTNSAGQFTFPAEVEPYCLVIAHDDGLAMVTEKGFAKSKELRLQPWTADNQQQQIIRRPARGQYVTFPPAGE